MINGSRVRHPPDGLADTLLAQGVITTPELTFLAAGAESVAWNAIGRSGPLVVKTTRNGTDLRVLRQKHFAMKGCNVEVPTIVHTQLFDEFYVVVETLMSGETLLHHARDPAVDTASLFKAFGAALASVSCSRNGSRRLNHFGAEIDYSKAVPNAIAGIRGLTLAGQFEGQAIVDLLDSVPVEQLTSHRALVHTDPHLANVIADRQGKSWRIKFVDLGHVKVAHPLVDLVKPIFSDCGPDLTRPPNKTLVESLRNPSPALRNLAVGYARNATVILDWQSQLRALMALKAAESAVGNLTAKPDRAAYYFQLLPEIIAATLSDFDQLFHETSFARSTSTLHAQRSMRVEHGV